VAGGVVLIGVCTTLMLLGIFMKYVNTSLLPTLEVRAEDYTMSQSSVVYYQDKESGQWVEFQKVHGQENRVLIDIDDHELWHYFPEMMRIGAGCRFYNCTHTHEPGCAVREAVERGEVARSRYESYLKIRDEDDKYRK